MDSLLAEWDILCLRETWLPKKDLGNLTTFPKFDVSTAIVRDRIEGGGCVNVLWGKEK